jgi:glycosyltransferase involved in cell wall biosynthesis
VRSSDGVITTNPSRAQVLAERYGVRVEVLANVPAVTEDVSPLDPGYPPGARTLLYQGGIYAESRAFREAIAALHELPEDFHLVILGFGRADDLDLIRAWAVEAGLQHPVHLLPPRPFDELVRTAAAATVGLVPVRADNLSNSLGDTNKLFEYLMAGLPMAASDLPEIRRVAAEGEPPVGEIFDPSSPSSVARAVCRIVEKPELYEARRKEARRLALERYNWTVEERKLLALYHAVSGT